jgi:hypothetical protein
MPNPIQTLSLSSGSPYLKEASRYSEASRLSLASKRGTSALRPGFTSVNAFGSCPRAHLLVSGVFPSLISVFSSLFSGQGCFNQGLMPSMLPVLSDYSSTGLLLTSGVGYKHAAGPARALTRGRLKRVSTSHCCLRQKAVYSLSRSCADAFSLQARIELVCSWFNPGSQVIFPSCCLASRSRDEEATLLSRFVLFEPCCTTRTSHTGQ